VRLCSGISESAPVSISDNYLPEERKERENKTKQKKQEARKLPWLCIFCRFEMERRIKCGKVGTERKYRETGECEVGGNERKSNKICSIHPSVSNPYTLRAQTGTIRTWPCPPPLRAPSLSPIANCPLPFCLTPPWTPGTPPSPTPWSRLPSPIATVRTVGRQGHCALHHFGRQK